MDVSKETLLEYKIVRDDVTAESTFDNAKKGLQNKVSKKLEETKGDIVNDNDTTESTPDNAKDDLQNEVSIKLEEVMGDMVNDNVTANSDNSKNGLLKSVGEKVEEEKGDIVNANGTAEPKLGNAKNGVHFGFGKELGTKNENVPNYGNSIVTQEKNKILQTITELQEIIINILKQKLKLADIRNKHFMNILSNGLEDVQKATDEAMRNYLDKSGENICEFQVIKEFLDSVKIKQEKDFTVNTERFLQECFNTFLTYEEMYKKRKIILSNFLRNVEKVLKFNILPRNCEIKEHVFYSIFEEKLSSYNRILASSETAFNHFESLIKNDLKTSEQDIDKVINLLLTAFNKVEYAFGTLKLLAVEVIKIDFAKV